MAQNATPTDRDSVRFEYEEFCDFSCLDELFDQEYAPDACRAIHMGCGKGDVAVYLAKRGLRVMGIDPNRELLAAARERSRLGDVDLDLMAGNPLELPPIPEESIGLNVDFNSAISLSDGLVREDFLRRVCRYLSRGGIVLAAGPSAGAGHDGDPDGTFAFGTPFVSDFTRAGFEVLMQGIRTLPNGDRRLVVHARKPG
jgi:SAM-dependent methyltransferase